MTDPTLERRLRNLEAGLIDAQLGEIHKITTGPEVRVDMRTTHADTETHAVKLVALDLPRRMLLRRVNFLAAATNKAVIVSLAMYRLTSPTRVDSQSDPVATLKKSAIARVATLGQSMFGPQNIKRQSVHIDKALLLEPNLGPYFLAWQTADSDTKLGVLPTNIAGLTNSASGDVEIQPTFNSANAPYASVRRHIGSVYLRGGKADFSMMMGATTGDTASVEFRRNSDASLLLTLTRTGAVDIVTASAISIANAGWYDLYLFCSNAAGAAYARGGYVRYSATDQTTNLPEQIFASAYDTRPAGAYAGDFPAELSITAAGVWVPLFVLRSALGLRQAGDFAYD